MTARRGPKEWHPDWGVHPGELVREALSAAGMTQTAAAEAIGMKPPQLNDMLTGRRGIGPVVALRIAVLTGISARLLVRMQADYDLHVAERAAQEKGETGA